MSDIRQTALLEDFSEMPADPGVDTTEYPLASSVAPWYTVPDNLEVRIDVNGLRSTHFPNAATLAFFSSYGFLGDNIETWGITGGDPALSDAWRWGFYTIDSILLGAANGYQALHGVGVGGIYVTIRRYDGGVPTTPAQSGGSFTGRHGGIWLMRRNASDIELWSSGDSGANWDFEYAITDTTYTTGPFFFVYGNTGVETSWIGIGGGVRNRQFIYRVLRAQPGIPA